MPQPIDRKTSTEASVCRNPSRAVQSSVRSQVFTKELQEMRPLAEHEIMAYRLTTQLNLYGNGWNHDTWENHGDSNRSSTCDSQHYAWNKATSRSGIASTNKSWDLRWVTHWHRSWVTYTRATDQKPIAGTLVEIRRWRILNYQTGFTFSPSWS